MDGKEGAVDKRGEWLTEGKSSLLWRVVMGYPSREEGFVLGSKFRYHARDHFGPALLPSRRRASIPAFNSINLPNSQTKSESRLR
jgi:hypothetical protein